VRSWLGLGEADADVVVRMRLKAGLAELLGDGAREVLPGLAVLLGVRLDPGDPLPASAGPLDPGGAVRAWVEALSAAGPVVIALDGFQWADASTLELTERLLELTDRTPTMLIVSLRPDPSGPAWAFRSKVLADYGHRGEELRLPPLPEDAARRLAEFVLPAREFDESSLGGLVQRSEGNPLFLEKLARNFQPRDRERTWSISIRELLPSSLESLLVARIDRLPEGARRLLQTAAVVGRTFALPVVAQVLGTGDLREELAVLFRADFVREVRRYPALECTFRHGLIQEAALETLTPERIRGLNGKVAAAYEELFADSLDSWVETLAYHYYRSEDQRSALRHLERAAEAARARGDRAGAADLWRRARKSAGRLGDEAADARLAGRLDELRRDSPT
jgi:predicted ATPase